MEKYLINVYIELLLLPKFDNSSPSVTSDKEICHVIMSYCHHYCLRRSTQWNPFNDVYLLSKFDVSSFSVNWRYIDSQTSHFADVEQFKNDIHFANFGDVRIDPVCSLLLTLDMSQLFCWVWVKQSKKNSGTTQKLFSMIQSSGIKNWCPQSINRL